MTEPLVRRMGKAQVFRPLGLKLLRSIAAPVAILPAEFTLPEFCPVKYPQVRL